MRKKPDTAPLTGLQLGVLRALWAQPGASVTDVVATLAQRRTLAPTTVATLLKRLEKRGLVKHETSGRQYRYHALCKEADVHKRAVDDVATEVFDGDVLAFASQLVSRKDVTPTDLARIREMIDERMKSET